MSANVFVSNDNDVVVTGFSFDADGSFINDARMTATLYDSATGAAITNGVITLAYVDGSNGEYRGTIPATGDAAVVLTAGKSYRCNVAARNYAFSEDVFFTAQQRVG